MPQTATEAPAASALPPVQPQLQVEVHAGGQRPPSSAGAAEPFRKAPAAAAESQQSAPSVDGSAASQHSAIKPAAALHPPEYSAPASAARVSPSQARSAAVQIVGAPPAAEASVAQLPTGPQPPAVGSTAPAAAAQGTLAPVRLPGDSLQPAPAAASLSADTAVALTDEQSMQGAAWARQLVSGCLTVHTGKQMCQFLPL